MSVASYWKYLKNSHRLYLSSKINCFASSSVEYFVTLLLPADFLVPIATVNYGQNEKLLRSHLQAQLRFARPKRYFLFCKGDNGPAYPRAWRPLTFCSDDVLWIGNGKANNGYVRLVGETCLTCLTASSSMFVLGVLKPWLRKRSATEDSFWLYLGESSSQRRS